MSPSLARSHADFIKQCADSRHSTSTIAKAVGWFLSLSNLIDQTRSAVAVCSLQFPPIWCRSRLRDKQCAPWAERNKTQPSPNCLCPCCSCRKICRSLLLPREFTGKKEMFLSDEGPNVKANMFNQLVIFASRVKLGSGVATSIPLCKFTNKKNISICRWFCRSLHHQSDPDLPPTPNSPRCREGGQHLGRLSGALTFGGQTSVALGQPGAFGPCASHDQARNLQV